MHSNARWRHAVATKETEHKGAAAAAAAVRAPHSGIVITGGSDYFQIQLLKLR